MERLDIHVALEVCEIVIESATLVPIVFALSGLPIYVDQFPLAPLICSLPFSQPFGLPVHLAQFPLARLIKPKNLVNEELTCSLQYLFEFRFGDLPNGVKDDVMFKCEKPLRTNEAGLIELAALTIAAIQRNWKPIEVRAACDLAENQIRAW
jgi:hypothetical protein